MSACMTNKNYSEEQEIYLHATFLQTKSLDKTRKMFQKKFPECNVPEKSMIDGIVRKYGESEILVSTGKKTKKNYQVVQDVIVSRVDDLIRGDSVARLNFCEWFFKSVNEGSLDSQFIFYTGECWFHLSGYVHTLNTHSWLSQKPEIPKTQPKDDKKVGIWCAISAERIIGPIFYEETLSATEYKTLILDPFLDELTEEERSKGWFQVESETIHADKNCKDKLGEVFGNRIISSGLWPARSPDLTPCTFYLWQKLIYKCYEIKPKTMGDLKKIIQQEIEKTEPRQLQFIHKNVISRYNTCISQGGEAFEYLL